MVNNSKRKTLFFIFFILTTVFAIIIGKVFFVDIRLLPLYIYGIAVTTVTFFNLILAFLFYKDPFEIAKELPIQKKTHPLVACFVAVHNDEHFIARCVNSLIGQTYDNTEIIIINDASTDNTAKILQQYASMPNVKIITLSKNKGKKKALALGMKKTRATIFTFSDSDSVIEKNAIKQAVAIFDSDPLIGAISGHVRAYNANKTIFTKIQDAWYEGQFSIRKAAESCFGAVTCVSGPLAIFKKAAIYNYIPAWEADSFLGQEFRFATDRTLTGFVLGSTSIGNKLKKRYAQSLFVTGENYIPREWKVVYSKACKAWTVVPETFRQMIMQQIRWKKSFIRNIFFTGTFFWKKNVGVVILYYSHIIFVLLGPIIAFRHMVYLPLQGVAVSAVLYFCGVLYMGSMFGLANLITSEQNVRWFYRPLMSLLSAFIFSWLIFYSALTIKKMVWIRNT